MLTSPPATKRMRTAPTEETPLAQKCRELRISPPRYEASGSGHRTEYMDLSEIEEQIAKDGFGHCCQDEKSLAVLIFLYGRKYKSDCNDKIRKRSILGILNDKDAVERTLKIAALGGDKNIGNAKEESPVSGPVGNKLRTDKRTDYDLWIGALEDLCGGDGYCTVFSQHETFRLVLRQQYSSNCFIHAAAVVHGYLVQMGTGQFHGMIDLSKFVRDCAEDELLTNLILTNNGGSSLDMLHTFALGKKGCLPSNTPNLGQEVATHFDKYGPSLVSNCKLDQNFLDFTQKTENKEDPYDRFKIPEFEDYVKANIEGTHAMVLIGYIVDDDGGYKFLLQNWWKHMQFCVVSSDYLIQSKAALWFVEHRQVEFGGKCTTKFTHAEAHFDDRSDGFFPNDVFYA